MKETDYLMNITEICMTIDELEGANKRRDFIDTSGTK